MITGNSKNYFISKYNYFEDITTDKKPLLQRYINMILGRKIFFPQNRIVGNLRVNKSFDYH